jgi:hypothetical protein
MPIVSFGGGTSTTRLPWAPSVARTPQPSSAASARTVWSGPARPGRRRPGRRARAPESRPAAVASSRFAVPARRSGVGGRPADSSRSAPGIRRPEDDPVAVVERQRRGRILGQDHRSCGPSPRSGIRCRRGALSGTGGGGAAPPGQVDDQVGLGGEPGDLVGGRAAGEHEHDRRRRAHLLGGHLDRRRRVAQRGEQLGRQVGRRRGGIARYVSGSSAPLRRTISESAECQPGLTSPSTAALTPPADSVSRTRSRSSGRSPGSGPADTATMQVARAVIESGCRQLQRLVVPAGHRRVAGAGQPYRRHDFSTAAAAAAGWPGRRPPGTPRSSRARGPRRRRAGRRLQRPAKLRVHADEPLEVLGGRLRRRGELAVDRGRRVPRPHVDHGVKGRARRTEPEHGAQHVRVGAEDPVQEGAPRHHDRDLRTPPPQRLGWVLRHRRHEHDRELPLARSGDRPVQPGRLRVQSDDQRVRPALGPSHGVPAVPAADVDQHRAGRGDRPGQPLRRHRHRPIVRPTGPAPVAGSCHPTRSRRRRTSGAGRTQSTPATISRRRAAFASVQSAGCSTVAQASTYSEVYLCPCPPGHLGGERQVRGDLPEADERNPAHGAEDVVARAARASSPARSAAAAGSTRRSVGRVLQVEHPRPVPGGRTPARSAARGGRRSGPSGRPGRPARPRGCPGRGCR